MNDKAEFAVEILREYAKQNQTPVRSTSDLSPLEQWLILRLADILEQSEQLPQDRFCKVCNLPTDGEKCYSKRCPV